MIMVEHGIFFETYRGFTRQGNIYSSSKEEERRGKYSNMQYWMDVGWIKFGYSKNI